MQPRFSELRRNNREPLSAWPRRFAISCEWKAEKMSGVKQVAARPRVHLILAKDLVRITIQPAFAGLGGGDDRVADEAGMFARVLVR
jgi:hypothetical protein